jgi:hypothetical protein
MRVRGGGGRCYCAVVFVGSAVYAGPSVLGGVWRFWIGARLCMALPASWSLSLYSCITENQMRCALRAAVDAEVQQGSASQYLGSRCGKHELCGGQERCGGSSRAAAVLLMLYSNALAQHSVICLWLCNYPPCAMNTVLAEGALDTMCTLCIKRRCRICSWVIRCAGARCQG